MIPLSRIRGSAARHRPRGAPVLGLAAGLLVAWLAGTGAAHAQRKRPAYCLLVSDIKAAEGVPADIAGMVRARLTADIDGHGRLVPALPEAAPDPQEAPDAFLAYMKKRRLTPYRVNVEITRYHQEVEEGPRGGRRLSVHLALRTFGETMPARVMAFSGAGAATIKLDLGKRLRERDASFARREAVAQAVGDALDESVRRLDEKRRRGRKRGRRKKKR